jgi:hypothetical protein
MRQDDNDEPDTDELEASEPMDDSDELSPADFEMMDDDADEDLGARTRSGTMTFLSGVVLGALVGAGIALLVAPERGSTMRRKLKKFARKVRARAEEKFDDLADDAGRELARRRRKLRQRIRERI